MRQLLQFFGSKVVLAILGALLIGGVSATLAFGTVPRRPAPAANVSANTGGASATTSASVSATASTSASVAPTDTSTPIATTGASPSATPGSQTITLRGTITAINATTTSFTLQPRSGAADTIVTDGNTTYLGNAAQFSDLTVKWTATVTAIAQPDGTYLATVVNASNNTDN